MPPIQKPQKDAPSRMQALLLALAAGAAAALLAYIALARATPSGRDGAALGAARPAAAQRKITGLALQISPFMRAVSIPLDPAGGATGFLEPGDHVDVFGTFDAGTQAEARLIVGNARLLALAARSGAGTDTPATSATLEVAPRDAQALALASARGRLTLALRGIGDNGEADLPPLPVQAPVAVAVKAAPPPAAPTRLSPPPLPAIHARAPLAAAPALPTITVVRGTQKTTMTVGE